MLLLHTVFCCVLYFESTFKHTVVVQFVRFLKLAHQRGPFEVMLLTCNVTVQPLFTYQIYLHRKLGVLLF